MRLDNVLSPTRVDLGSRCYRRHAISDILERQKTRKASLEFGTAVHFGVGAWWGGGGSIEAVSAATTHWQEMEQWMDKKHSQELLIDIINRYCNDALVGTNLGPSNAQIVTVEDRLPIEIDGRKLTFQVDRLVSEENQRLYLIDTKTTGLQWSRWEKQWDLNLQMQLYKYCIERLYDMPCTVIMEGVSKSDGEIYCYMCPDWTEEQLQEAVEQFKRISDEDRRTLEVDEEDRIDYILNRTDFNRGDCWSYNTPCDFLPLCQAKPIERAGLLESEYIEVPGEY
jgi:PD-(D/E)XK nuclease superfamily protein